MDLPEECVAALGAAVARPAEGDEVSFVMGEVWVSRALVNVVLFASTEVTLCSAILAL